MNELERIENKWTLRIAELEEENKRLRTQFKIAYRLWLQDAQDDLGEVLEEEGT